MHPGKREPIDESILRSLEAKTGIPRARLEKALQGQLDLTSEETKEVAKAGVKLPEWIKKPFGN